MADGITSKSKIPDDLAYEPPVHFGFVEIRAGVVIGRHSYVNEGLVHAGTKIGRFCSIGRRVTIGAGSHPMAALTTSPFFMKMRNGTVMRREGKYLPPVEIGHDVWIGDNATILQGVKIGHGAVVGAGAVVTKDVAPYSVVGGVPSRVLKMRFSDLLISQLLETEWWNYSDDIILDLPVNDPATCSAILKTIQTSKKPFDLLGY